MTYNKITLEELEELINKNNQQHGYIIYGSKKVIDELEDAIDKEIEKRWINWNKK